MLHFCKKMGETLMDISKNANIKRFFSFLGIMYSTTYWESFNKS